jgi:hypothetical protein
MQSIVFLVMGENNSGLIPNMDIIARPTTAPNQPPKCSHLKWLEHEDDYSPPSIPEVNH